MKARILSTVAVLAILLALVAGCGPTQPVSPTAAPEQPTAAPEEPTAVPEQPTLEGKLIIFHAGSLTVPVDELAKAFQAQYPDVVFETEAAGSRTTARKVSELGREADLVMSADYTVIDNLLIPDFADWNVRFARNTVVVAYTDQSKHADEMNAENWYDILTREGVVYGHSEPDADPCGYRTLMVWQLAEKYYDQPGLYEKLDENCPPENIRPKSVELIALLESGDMDYAFEYRSVAVQHELEFVELPDELNLSMVKHTDFYSQAQVELSGEEPGETITMNGKPIVYGVTIPKNAPSPELAVEFVKFLLGPEGQAVMEKQGQPPIVPPVSADVDSLPAGLKDIVEPAAAAEAPAADVALSVTGAVENELTLSRTDLEAMGAEEVTVEHPKKGEQTYEGVRLSKVLEAAGPTGDTLTFVADDGYTIDLALADAQACEDCLVVFDGDSLRSAMSGMEGMFWVKGLVGIEVTGTSEASEATEVVDALGRTITFDEPPQNIVVPGKGSWMVGHPLYLFPNASERLLAMEDRRGTVSTFLSAIDPNFDDKPHLEHDAAPEQIAPLQPDVVIIKSYMQERLGNPLEELGIPVVCVELETPDQYFDDLRTFGKLLGDPERAEEVVSFYQSRLDRLSAKVEEIDDADKPDVLVVQHISQGGEIALEVPPPSYMQTIQVERAGGNPVWVDDVEGSGWSVVNLEQIAAWDADKIFLIAFTSDPDAVVEELKADPTWQELRAVQDGELYGFPMDYYGWDVPDPRWILGMTWAATKIQPDVFSDVDIMQEVYDFYGELYGMDEDAIDELIVPQLKGDIE